jgi:MFS family permease
VIFEVPSNIVMHRVGARMWIARIMLSWAVLSALTAFVKTPTTFYILRFLLGAAEAGFIPGILLYLTYWWPAARRGRITALFLAAIPMSGILGGPISGLVLQLMSGLHGLRGWQWLFLIEAVPSVILGLAIVAWLPNSIDKAKWLTDAEKATLRANIEREVGAGKNLPSCLTDTVIFTCHRGAFNDGGCVFALAAVLAEHNPRFPDRALAAATRFLQCRHPA